MLRLKFHGYATSKLTVESYRWLSHMPHAHGTVRMQKPAPSQCPPCSEVLQTRKDVIRIDFAHTAEVKQGTHICHPVTCPVEVGDATHREKVDYGLRRMVRRGVGAGRDGKAAGGGRGDKRALLWYRGSSKRCPGELRAGMVGMEF